MLPPIASIRVSAQHRIAAFDIGFLAGTDFPFNIRSRPICPEASRRRRSVIRPPIAADSSPDLRLRLSEAAGGAARVDVLGCGSPDACRGTRRSCGAGFAARRQAFFRPSYPISSSPLSRRLRFPPWPPLALSVFGFRPPTRTDWPSEAHRQPDFFCETRPPQGSYSQLLFPSFLFFIPALSVLFFCPLLSRHAASPFPPFHASCFCFCLYFVALSLFAFVGFVFSCCSDFPFLFPSVVAFHDRLSPSFSWVSFGCLVPTAGLHRNTRTRTGVDACSKVNLRRERQ